MANDIPTTAQRLLRENAELVRPEGNLSTEFQVAKRLIDIVGGIALLILLSPVLLTTWVILMITTRGNPFFVQRRVGFLGKSFPMIKFRTMRTDAERVRHLVQNQHSQGPIFKNKQDPRVTPVGRFLRRTSIDEMPQLLNVIAGHMSLVGPRPPIVAEVEKYEAWHRRRLSVKPGLTCLWQVSGRSEIGFEDWVRMDLWYLNNQSLWTDLTLLLRTPWSVLTGRGAY